ncbi:hypothetical protein RJ639_036405 [Escallonia herrerae]|uniref:Uncharacterized protein n=1 Tax=Escallonia herrerae TaxID=1293975 RepID=A0AA88WPY0_9ASTE|nr:hypothetical protein RJ639_036405 [Escallonia herrerae]
MPKKNSSKAPKSTPTNPVTEQEEKPSATPKRPGSNEIDEIFASKKKKNSQQVEGNKLGPKPKEMKRTKKKDRDEGHRKQKAVVDHAPPPRPRKKTGDGLVVYTEEELGFGKEDAGVVYDLNEFLSRSLDQIDILRFLVSAYKGPRPGLAQWKCQLISSEALYSQRAVSTRRYPQKDDGYRELNDKA